MCACSPRRRSPGDARDPRDRLGRLGHREAELRVGLAGRDLLVRVAADVGRHARSAPAGRCRCPRSPRRTSRSQAVDLVEVVDHDQAHAVLQRHAQLGLGLGVAVQHDPLGRESPAPSARCSSPPEATSHHRPSSANSSSTAVQGKALEANTTWKSSCPRRRPACHERARARAQIVLGDDVGGRAELARQLDRVAAADLQPAALVQAPAAEAGTRRRERLVPVGHAADYRCARHAPGRLDGSRAAPVRSPDRPSPAHHPAPARPSRSTQQRDALELRRGQPREHLVVAPDELDEEAARARCRTRYSANTTPGRTRSRSCHST